jgi:LacI family transcriptional regulator
MQQIADAAGVSRMAVSLALRNSPKISAPTAQRIRLIAKEMGYRPNPMVSALMTQLRHTRDVKKPSALAYVTAFPTEGGWRRIPSMVAIHDGVQRRAAELGYSLEEWWLRRPDLAGPRFCEELRSRDIHGLIVAPLPGGGDEPEIEWPQFAGATIAHSVSAELSRATNDHLRTMEIALRELTALGYRRIGLAFLEDRDVRMQQHWMAGMLAHQQQLPLAERVPAFCGAGRPARSFGAWFHEHQPHAVLSAGGECLRLFREMELRVPQDVGFANLELTSGEHDMAGVNQHADLVGAAAVDLVDAQLRQNERGLPRIARTVLIPGEWVAGPTVRDLQPAPRRVKVRA